MTLPLFPAKIRGLGYSVVKTPEFRTLVSGAENGSGDDVRIQLARNPIWHFAMVYDFVMDRGGEWIQSEFAPYTDLQRFMGFFMAAGGGYADLLFSDPDDNSVGPAMLPGVPPVPNPAAQLQILTDLAGNWYSPLQRNMGGLFLEDITDLDPTPALAVFANGVLQRNLTNYTIAGPGLALPGSSFRGLYLSWGASEPAAPVTAEFKFCFRVCFEADTMDFEKFMNLLWTIGGENASQGAGSVKLRSSRPVGI